MLVICLMGPTACGKTAQACNLSTQLPIQIISVDSAMIYRDMNIGSAKPSTEILKLYPHALVDIKNPNETYSAAEFCQDAKLAIENTWQEQKIPVLVGGTMMYFHALQQGLSTLPSSTTNSREYIEQKLLTHGLAQLYAELQQVDPLTYNKLHANDKQRICRALEVYYLSHTPLSALINNKQKTPYNFINISLIPEHRSNLHDNIALRLSNMLELGFLDEVCALQKKWQVNATHASMRCVGYRQALEYLAQDYDYTTFYAKTLSATRNLAKRQITWLNKWTDNKTFFCEDENLTKKLIEYLTRIIYNS
jgi:tRNA dimethylallyltransferase